MTRLTHSVTGHQINSDDASAEFWVAAGYRADEPAKKAPAKKAQPKKSASK